MQLNWIFWGMATKEAEEFLFCFHKKFSDNTEAWAHYSKTNNNICLSSDLATIHLEVSKLFVFGKENNQLNLVEMALMSFVKIRKINKSSKTYRKKSESGKINF